MRGFYDGSAFCDRDLFRSRDPCLFQTLGHTFFYVNYNKDKLNNLIVNVKTLGLEFK